MRRGLWGDPGRYLEQDWSKYDGLYLTDDGAKRDKDGYSWLLGRVDDVMNASGHGVSPLEAESALADHKAVAEAAVIGTQHDIEGQAIAAFVTERRGRFARLMDELTAHVARKIGSPGSAAARRPMTPSARAGSRAPTRSCGPTPREPWPARRLPFGSASSRRSSRRRTLLAAAEV